MYKPIWRVSIEVLTKLQDPKQKEKRKKKTKGKEDL